MIIYDSHGWVAGVLLTPEDMDYILSSGSKGLVLLSVLTPIGALGVYPPVKHYFQSDEEMDHFHRSMVREFNRRLN
jgi:hypothetical protein